MKSDVARIAIMVAVACGGACTIVDDAILPGAPCDTDLDCGRRQVCSGPAGAGVCAPSDGVVDDPPVGCTGKADGDDCSDGNPCTDNDVCAGGTCAGTAKQCGEGTVCSAGTCVDLGACTLDGAVKRVSTTGHAANPAIAYDADRDDFAVAFEDEAQGVNEIFLQLLDTSGVPVGPAVRLTDGSADANGNTHPSFEPSIVYNTEQKEFGLAWVSFSLLLTDVVAATATATGVPAGAHQLTIGEAAEDPVIAWTGATYAAAWVSGVSDNGTNISTVEMAALDDDASKASFSNKTISFQGAGFGVALAFNPRTTSFGFAYRLDGDASLVLTTTNVDGAAPVDTAVPNAGEPHRPALAVTPAGFAIVWLDDPEDDGVGALRFATISDGLVSSSPVTITDAGEAARRPAIAAVANGVAVAYEVDGAVQLRILALDGTPSAARTVGAGASPSVAGSPTSAGVVFDVATADTSDLFASTQCLVP